MGKSCLWPTQVMQPPPEWGQSGWSGLQSSPHCRILGYTRSCRSKGRAAAQARKLKGRSESLLRTMAAEAPGSVGLCLGWCHCWPCCRCCAPLRSNGAWHCLLLASASDRLPLLDCSSSDLFNLTGFFLGKHIIQFSVNKTQEYRGFSLISNVIFD